MNSGLFGFWLRFGSVTGLFKPAPSPKPRQKPKILAAHRYIFSVNALVPRPLWGRHHAALGAEQGREDVCENRWMMEATFDSHGRDARATGVI